MSFIDRRYRYMNEYDIHKALINDYLLRKEGDTSRLRRDASKDKRDIDVIKENHKFLWDNAETPSTWEQRLAKRYYDKLFKEYCICDLSKYKENKVALRWRVEGEVVEGVGQFSCANKRCGEKEDLTTWEVNFAYKEDNERRNALVKLRLCFDCAKKLNYHSQKRQVKRIKKRRIFKSMKRKSEVGKGGDVEGSDLNLDGEGPSKGAKDARSGEGEAGGSADGAGVVAENPEAAWENVKAPKEKTEDEEIEDYLCDLLL